MALRYRRDPRGSFSLSRLLRLLLSPRIRVVKTYRSVLLMGDLIWACTQEAAHGRPMSVLKGQACLPQTQFGVPTVRMSDREAAWQGTAKAGLARGARGIATRDYLTCGQH